MNYLRYILCIQLAVLVLAARDSCGQGKGLADGRLADISPTLLALMGLAQPAEMTGQSLLR